MSTDYTTAERTDDIQSLQAQVESVKRHARELAPAPGCLSSDFEALPVLKAHDESDSAEFVLKAESTRMYHAMHVDPNLNRSMSPVAITFADLYLEGPTGNFHYP